VAARLTDARLAAQQLNHQPVALGVQAMLKAIPTLCLQSYFALTRGGGHGSDITSSGDMVSRTPSFAKERLPTRSVLVLARKLT
jgi:hypothetical protein